MHRLLTFLVLAAVAALFAACNPGGGDGLESEDPFATPSTPVMTELPSLEPSAMPSEEAPVEPSTTP